MKEKIDFNSKFKTKRHKIVKIEINKIKLRKKYRGKKKYRKLIKTLK